MNKQIVIAIFLGYAASYKLNFATGMNGDEDLGQDIIMKGEKFHYAEAPAKGNQTAAGRYQTSYVQLGWDNPVQGPAEGVLFPQTGHAEHHTTYFAKKQPDESFVQWDNPVQGPAEGVLFPQTGHAEHHTTYYAKKSPEEAFVNISEDYGEPEKVETLDPKIARTHTTFYDKQNGVWRQQLAKVDPIGPTNYDPWVYETSKEAMGAQVQHAKQAPQNQTQAVVQAPIGKKGYNAEVYEFLNDHGYNKAENEYVAFEPIGKKGMDPEVFKLLSENGYNQETKDLSMLETEPEKVQVLEPIAYQNRADTNQPGPRTTFYDKKNGLWRQEATV